MISYQSCLKRAAQTSNNLKSFKKVLDKIKWVWYNELAVWDSEAMNHDNLRLNSTHNPENSHIFLGENEQSEVRA